MLIIYSFFIFSFISQVREGYMCTIRSIFYEVINMNINQSMILLILKDLLSNSFTLSFFDIFIFIG
jgi:hypothetical protein